jgi:cell division cycle 20, cofactor of APC complex
MFTQKDRVELEEVMDAQTEIQSSVMPRWQRRALRQSQQAAASSALTPSKRPRAAMSSSIVADPSPRVSRVPCSPPCQADWQRWQSWWLAATDASQACRVVPSRAGMDADVAQYALTGSDEMDDVTDKPYRAALAASLLGAGSIEESESAASAAAAAVDEDSSLSSSGSNCRVLSYSSKAPVAPDSHLGHMRVLYSQNKGTRGVRAKATRHIPSAPERCLDAPDLVDDYYLNLLDWSCANVVAVALGQSVYLWNAATGATEALCELQGEEDYVTSVSWIKEGGGYLAVGTASADVQLWDVEKMKQVRSMKGHTARVGALDWNTHVLSSGSRDSTIMNHDVRVRDHHIATLRGHEQEVCGLKWSPDGSMLASGGNDNLLCIWDASGSMTPATAATGGVVREVAPRHVLRDHMAAVKALAWCPWSRTTLASGGGSSDRTIKTWNASSGALLNSIDTGSQVCSLLFNPNHRELVSSHGFSRNEISVWKYPSFVKVRELTGHTARVLHMAAGPDGSSVATAGADETLRFWRLLGEPKDEEKAPAVESALARSSLVAARSIR